MKWAPVSLLPWFMGYTTLWEHLCLLQQSLCAILNTQRATRAAGSGHLPKVRQPWAEFMHSIPKWKYLGRRERNIEPRRYCRLMKCWMCSQCCQKHWAAKVCIFQYSQSSVLTNGGPNHIGKKYIYEFFSIQMNNQMKCAFFFLWRGLTPKLHRNLFSACPKRKIFL